MTDPVDSVDSAAALRVLERNWRSDGYTSPNLETYPWQWLWDSCFHAIIWAALGDGRATVELERAFVHQRPNGFVPHVGYQHDPPAALALWGIEGASTLTQPPMYAHAARRLANAGRPPSPVLLARIEAGLEHLWRVRPAGNGLLSCFHPWEGGTDDSPRWDAWTLTPFDRFGHWKRRKRELVDALVLDEHASPTGSRAFVVQSAAFNALCAFNALEFADLTGSSEWRRRGEDLTAALDARWDEALGTWTDAADDGPCDTGVDHDSGAVRTLEALLGVLVTPDERRADRVFTDLFDPTAYGARFGPCGLHRDEPAFDPDAYWRGANWPQLVYLLWVAATRRGHPQLAERLACALREGAAASGHAEYWNPDTGEGRGAAPQSWTCLYVATV
ncbi:hypothetical protein [Egicoccus sp. AB-alg6-2]|uniref:MGH1-like glycoside hydrolase domain-containing protein n=1 Tax=Egicoccus sp. AB-alg6-2 TaxID=3242692 RepID=UPI00359E54BF